MDRLTVLFVYVILAPMWNALAGYAGLVSVGQQLFLGLGAYFLTVRLPLDWGVDPFVSMVASAAVIVGVIAVPLSFPMLRLSGGEFAIGMWVVAELAHLLVNLDPLVRGETGNIADFAQCLHRRAAAPRPDLLASRLPHWWRCSAGCSSCCAAGWAQRSRRSATMRRRRPRWGCASPRPSG